LGWPLSEADVIDRLVGPSDEFMQSAVEEPGRWNFGSSNASMCNSAPASVHS
jgi:hypothetical protein